MPKKPIDPATRWYTDREVHDFVHNAMLSCVRWERMHESLPKRALALRNFANGLVLSLRDLLSQNDDGSLTEQVMTDEEIAVALIVAAEVLLVATEDKHKAQNVDKAVRAIEKGNLKSVPATKKVPKKPKKRAYKRRNRTNWKDLCLITAKNVERISPIPIPPTLPVLDMKPEPRLSRAKAVAELYK